MHAAISVNACGGFSECMRLFQRMLQTKPNNFVHLLLAGDHHAQVES